MGVQHFTLLFAVQKLLPSKMVQVGGIALVTLVDRARLKLPLRK